LAALAATAPDVGPPTVRSDLVRALVTLAVARVTERGGAPPLGRGDDLFVMVNDYLCDHCADPLTRTGVAASFRITPAHLSRICRAHGGETFVDLLTGIRIGQACDALVATTATVSEVAAACGFGDVGYFHRVFRRCMGVSPGAYRRSR
jgi:AraC-like DNA-binding protein